MDFWLVLSKNDSNIICSSIKNKSFLKIWRVWHILKVCHALWYLKIEMGIAGSIFELHPPNFQKMCIFWRFTNDIKVWVKKSGQIFFCIPQKWRLLRQLLLSKGVINSFKWLKWGIVCICILYSFWDMIRNTKNTFLKNPQFCKKICQNLTSDSFYHFCHLKSW